MEGTARIWFTPQQRAELWERWKNGQCVADIARALERRNKSGVYRGKEMADHKSFTIATNVQVYFCDPHSPWQRGSNENTNGLLRQYFPRGTDLSRFSQDYLNRIARRLSCRRMADGR